MAVTTTLVAGIGAVLSNSVLRWLLIAGLSVTTGEVIGSRFFRPIRSAMPHLPGVPSWAIGGALAGLVGALGSAARLISTGGGVGSLWQSTEGRAALVQAVGFGCACIFIQVRRPLWVMPPLAVVAAAEGVRSKLNDVAPALGAVIAATHLISAAVWVGTLLYTIRAAAAWRSEPPAVWQAVTAYSRLALGAFLITGVTGMGTAVILVPLSVLTTTGYGLLLLAKLALVVTATAMALAANWALGERLARLDRVRRLAPLELAALLAVLVIAAVLASAPIPS